MDHPPFGQTYLVGGSVRDMLLGLPVEDRDWVVVGATPQQMLAAGFVQVGKDFPVFLHPHTKEEYALARTERKSGRGYTGFIVHASPEVTLEEDLLRRDLTINAMARAEDGRIIDPYGGQRDLQDKVLRHVSPAFAEDPLRVLRLARFAARFADFSIAPETIALARSLVHELSSLPAERVWQEFARGLAECAPERMLETLLACNAWPEIAPEVPTAQFDVVTRVWRTLPRDVAQRFAALALACDDVTAAMSLAQRWKVPRECAELAQTAWRSLAPVRSYGTLTANEKVQFFVHADAFRRGERFAQALTVVGAWIGLAEATRRDIERDWAAAQRVNTAEIAARVPPSEIRAAVHAARTEAIVAGARPARTGAPRSSPPDGP